MTETGSALSDGLEGRSAVAIEAGLKVAANVKLEMIDEFPSVEFFHTIPLLALSVLVSRQVEFVGALEQLA